MIVWWLIISTVVGYREYFREYNSNYGYENDQCPELHTLKPDMHPHQCVSYALICKDVTEVLVKTEVNGTQHLCHPRFQPWGAGSPTKDSATVHCGYEGANQLVMELLVDGHYKFYCKSITDDKNKRCLITALQQGLFRCQFCKHPYYGDDCKKTLSGFDQRYTNPPRQCVSSNCLECEDSISCTKCIPGRDKKDASDNTCSADCVGFTSCPIVNNQYQYSNVCIQGTIFNIDRCPSCPNGCLTCTQDQMYSYKRSCDVCDSNYFREQVRSDEPNTYACYKINYCDISRQQKISQTNQNGLYVYNIKCTLCDPGYFFDNNIGLCQWIPWKKSNCLFLDSLDNNCIACYSWHGLQMNGSCQPITCNSKCFTCLDTNPEVCTTCDGFNNKILDNGTCLCKPYHGLKLEMCVPCSDGYCHECELEDFFSCISCTLGTNRILVNKQCICQPGSYEPEDGGLICIVCDWSCLTCSGPTNFECTQCPDESTSDRIQFASSCPCKTGYADFGIQEAKCGKCHPRCQTCFQAADETTNQYCITCIPGQNRVVTDYFNCDCKANYGDFDGTSEVCLICHYTCGICNDFGSTHCTQCLESSYRQLTTQGECLCKTSYYDDQTDSIQCQKCHYSCLKCSNSTEQNSCIECPPTRKPSDLLATQFECLCSSLHSFDDGLSPICQECDVSCLTCYGPLSFNCLTCDSTYRQLDLSSCICLVGYYDVGQLECTKCHYSCLQCFDNTAEGCIICSIDSHLRVLKGNSCKCIDGYYEESGTAICKKCSYKCETCENQPDKCLSCPQNSLRILDSVKGCYCPGEYYDQENEITCQKCHFKCKTCNAQNEDSCLSCDSIAYRELNLKQCRCQPHYFEMNVQECAICSAYCYECISNFENCISCQNDRYLVVSTCKCISKFQGALISTFEFNGMVKCQKCHYSCGTCGGVEEVDCISCIDTDYRIQVANTCVCKEGYFDAGLPVCEKCSYKCKGCMKQSELCISCQDNSLRQFVQGFNKCKCIQRYYDDGQNEVCQSIYFPQSQQECHYSCLRCNDIDTKCELCSIESNRIYNDQLFSCDCDVGYYDAGVEICQKCHYSCLNCNFGGSNSCYSCVDSIISNRVFHNNSCKCLFGYFDDGQSIKCQKCDIQCLSCINQSYLCSTCPQTRKIESNCKCQQGYYDVGLQLCSKCNSNCFTCQYTSNNCTSCGSDQFRELNLITNTCDCQIGYLEINGICQQCHPSCKTCSLSLNLCTSCVQFRYLKNNNCICNDGMFESILDKQCKLCLKTCLTCSYSSNYCLTCSIDNYRIFKSGNTCQCQQGYYEDPITQACEQCAKSCLTCSILYDNCLTCDTNLNLSLINNKCLCQQSYYFDSLTKQCQQCNITCLECSNNNKCTSCRLTTRHFDYDQNKCLCNDGYFETNQSNCQQCHLSCETCVTINTNCLSCNSIFNRVLTNNKCLCIDGYYDAGIELCQKCDSNCKTCHSSASICLSCYENEQNRYQSSDKCLCKSGYFESNTAICLKCSNECKTCQNSADYCTSCDINSKRYDQSVIHKCPCIIGFYQDSNQICQKCHYKCQTCINQNDQCLTCKFEQNQNRNSLSDQCNCKDGYYDDGTQLQCQKCNIKCKTCLTDSNNCQICQSSIRINPPTCNCIDGYYEDQQFTCQICAYNCNTCAIQPSNCLTCKLGRFGNDCKCSDGQFENGSIFCEQCAFQCSTCNSFPFNCNTCKGNRIKEPQCICPSGYFDDLLNEDCQLCDSTCLECNINGCLSCYANRILNEEMDCIPPPNSIWYNNTPWCSTCQVAVVKAYLSDDISKIIIHFDFPLNSKGFTTQFELNKCLQLFELESVQTFGQNSQCFLNPDDNQELLISLGENSKINIGDEILFKSSSLSHINCETSLQKFIFTTLQMPINLLAPLVEYHVPLHKLNPYAENFVYLKSIKNNGNRKLDNIIWSYQVEKKQDIQTLEDFIVQVNFLQEYNLLIPKFTFPTDAMIKFKIQYQNFIQVYSYSEFTVYTHSGNLPQIDVNVKPSYFVYETINIGLSVGSLFQSYQVDNSKYMIQISEIDVYPKKSSSSRLNISMESNSFEKKSSNITQYSLSPNSTYTFLVIATNLDTNKAQYQNFSIDIPFAGLVCQFNSKGLQSIRKDLNLQIECKDLDTTYAWNDDPDLYFQVTCKDITLNNSCMNQQKQFINVNVTDSQQFIKKNSISFFTVQEWSVTVTKFQQTYKFNQIIVYLEDDFIVLDLDFNQGYLMRNVNNFEQLNFTFLIPFDQKPVLLDLSIAIIYNYEMIEILQPKYISHQFKLFNSIQELLFGDTINLKFSAQYTNNIMPSLNTLKLTINQPPICSKLIIISSNDLALTSMIVATTCERSNDSPYKYQLRVFLREQDLKDFLKGSSDNSLILYPFQYQTQFSIQIPTSVDSSKIGLLLQVLDSGGSMTPVYDMIVSKPAKIDCSKISFQNLNLQNKIALLFEAMNQKCQDLHNQIYLDLLYQKILQDQNDNILKFQAIKLYQQFLLQSASSKPQNRALIEANQQRCYNLNSNRLYITQNSTENVTNLTKNIDDLKENIRNLDLTFQYFSRIKKQSEEELLVNNYIWNQELFQQLQNSQDCLISILYQVDEIYFNFKAINTKDATIYLNIVQLLKYTNLISEEIQNTIMVNDKPLVIQGKEIIWQMKRRTKQMFNQQFNIETTYEDYLIDFIQYESTFLQTNPLRLTSDLDYILQQQFNDKTLHIFSDNYYLIKLKNIYKSRFIQLGNFSSIYSIKFGTYEICSNDSQKIEEYELQCMLKTIFGTFHQCYLNKEQNIKTIELTCECNSFGEIFLVSSRNFSLVDVKNNSAQEIDPDITQIQDNLLPLIICTGSLTIIFLAIYAFQLVRDLRDKSEINEQDSSILIIRNSSDKNQLIYKGNNKIFKQMLKYIHQTLSIFYYKDKQIQFCYRILEFLSQFNLLLALNILQFFLLKNNNISMIYGFMIINPLIVFILRIIYKIIESIYRFRRIFSIISQLFLIILLILPNLILIAFIHLRLQIQSEQYLLAICFLVNILISQILIEPISIFGRIVIYRLIASSLKEMELNPLFHLMHFFVMHSSLEEIFDEFIKI